MLQRVSVTLLACALAGGLASAAEPVLPEIEDVAQIYVLGPFDIPDLPPNQDRNGLQDRPRIVLWQHGEALPLTEPNNHYEALAERVIELLGPRYQTIPAEKWHHEYHHVAEHHEGGLVMTSGEIVGWLLKAGGLGRLEFGYDPQTEKVGWWRPASQTPPQSVPMYRVHHCD